MMKVKFIVLNVAALLFLLAQTAGAEEMIKVLMLDSPNAPLPSKEAEQADNISGKIFINGKFYKGSLRILRDKNGLHVINSIPFDDYIEAAVAAEIEKNWELEALKAQAVISRTYALFYKNRNANNSYHLSSGTLHTLYNDNIDPLIPYAVKATKDEVLAYDNYPIKALYHDTCEGNTELPEEVWKESYPYLKSVSCNSRNAPYENWKRKFTLQEIAKALRVSDIKSIEIAAFTITGRAKTLLISVEDESAGITTKKITAIEFRELLGPNELPSTAFSVSTRKDTILFTGNGHGHGVGLSMWGALEMARQGSNYKEILSHYYPGSAIHNSDELHHHEFVAK
jgi:stage II sporulation protein D